MRRVQGLLRSVDRVQQRSRWLGFPVAVMGKFRDDHGGALTTVIAYNAFFALFPLLLVVVTVLGFLLGRDSGFQQRLLSSAVADFPIIGDQVQDNIHGLRGSGVGLVIGLVVFAVGLAATSLLTWLGSYGGKAVAVALANLAAAAAVNVGLFLLAFRVLTPRQVPTRQLVAGALVAGVAWQALQAVGGYLVDHYLRHTSQVYGVFAIVLGLLFWLYLGARLTLYAAEVNVVAAWRLWPRASNDDAWPSATPEPRPRGPLLGPAVSLTLARPGDHMGRMEKLSLEALAREQMK